MEPKIQLLTLRCSQCGANLKTEKLNEPCECVNCGVTAVPVLPSSFNAPAAPVKIDGIKTPSSALAYAEQLLEGYDWEGFAYSRSFSLKALDQLTESLKVTSSDDPKTWYLCFLSAYTPLIRKVKAARTLLNESIIVYETDDLEAFSRFDAYKAVCGHLDSQLKSISEALEGFITKFKKYDGDANTLAEMESKLSTLAADCNLPYFDSLTDIPAIKNIKNRRDEKIVNELAKKGIDARALYSSARQHMLSGNNFAALSQLVKLNGYLDSEKLIERIDKYFLFSDLLEVNGKKYFFKKSEDGIFSLYPTAEKSVASKPVIKGIKQVVTNFAGYLYYIDQNNYLNRLDLNTNKGARLDEKTYSSKDIWAYDYKVYLLRSTGHSSNELISLDLPNSTLSVIATGVKSVISFQDGYVAYYTGIKNGNSTDSVVAITKLATLHHTYLKHSDLQVRGYLNNSVVFTTSRSHKDNHTLYIKALGNNSAPLLLERNICDFGDIEAGKIFYYVGSNHNDRYLISINPDGSCRKEMPLFIDKILFEQGGWLYFTRTRGHNSLICRCRTDGSEYKVVASEIDHFVTLMNGYLYYVDDSSTLMRIRMDGSNHQSLRRSVDDVLSVMNNRIVFTAFDDYHEVGNSSIYIVDGDGRNIKKLASGVTATKEYDDETIFFTSVKKKRREDGEVSVTTKFYSLNIRTESIELLLEHSTHGSTSGTNNTFAVAMVIAVLLFLIGFVAFAAEATPFGTFAIITAFISLFVALISKSTSS